MSQILLQKIGFTPKEGAVSIFLKKYPSCLIEVDLENNTIDYGGSIVFNETKNAVQNITKPEDWVVLECVNRLLEKGYKPKDIALEKVYPTGHGTSGRLDILVRKNNKAFLMIECKTWGKEFEKEFKETQKNGGQLFTYFQQDTNADFLMLYTSHVYKDGIEYKNEIIKIEDHYRDAGNIFDFFDRWNKITNQNGIFEEWVEPYCFENKALTKNDLKELTAEDSNFIFYEFLSILRKHSISDKPNAFNKIFNLFLCKLFDEKKKLTDELDFQWKEKTDNAISFQIRLINLYKAGMQDFLEKEVVGISEDMFKSFSEQDREKQKKNILMFNKVFDIKEVFDDESFDDNQRVLKEVVELLQIYQVRYPQKQQHLSDFFELLLTTGLKQEAGQFFTPPPIARFIIKSLPLKEKIETMLKANETPKLPAVVDYAAGSGHFLTEAMEEMQDIIDKVDTTDFYPDVVDQVEVWQTKKKYDWASKYIYGIEKDYRLVKVAKVGCYFYGDGLAQVIHGDGIDSFSKSRSYRGTLKQAENKKSVNHPVFDFVISNPPYSIASFRGDMKKGEHPEKDFELYSSLTDRSSEIECLFIERTKQLLKEGGIAAVILPSSILSNTGIYTRSREILLKNFEWVAVAELGSNTFMATGTNTVVLFLRRRSNDVFLSTQEGVNKAFHNQKDVTVNGIEKAFSVYLSYVWEGVSFSDYQTFLNKKSNNTIQSHEIYQEYQKKIKAKNDVEKWQKMIELEQEKMTYFLLAYRQKVILVKSGQKKVEKAFLGYEFSSRRGSEGMHPIQRGKSVDDCTKLFDPNVANNPQKASTYILDAFSDDYSRKIDDEMKPHVSRVDLVDIMTFERVDFEKTVSLNVKKKIKCEDIWKTANLVLLGEIADIQKGTSITSTKIQLGKIPVVAGGQQPAYFHNQSNRSGDIVTISASGAYSGFVNYFLDPIFASDCNTIASKDSDKISTKLIFEFLKSIQSKIYELQRGQAQPHVYGEDLANIKIPLPSKSIQQKIVDELEALEKKENRMSREVEKLRNQVAEVIDATKGSSVRLQEVATKIGSGATPRGGEGSYTNEGISLIRSQNIYDYGFVEKGLAFINEEQAKQLNNVTVEKNDILFNITGASIARCCLVEDKYLPARVNQHVSIIRTNKKALPKYVQMILISSEYKNKLLQIGEGATSRQAITKSQLEEFKIPLPAISEQQKMVSKIEKIEDQIAELDLKLAKIPQEKEVILRKYL